MKTTTTNRTNNKQFLLSIVCCVLFTAYSFAQPLTVTCIGTNVACTGQCNGSATAIPSGGTPPYTYLWSNSQTTQTATGLCAGSYTVIVRDASITGNVATCNPTITQSAAMVVMAGPNSTICLGMSAILNATTSGGTLPYTYSWFPSLSLSNPNVQNPVAAPTTTTTYTVIVTDATGCTGSATVTVVVMPSSPVFVSGPTTICAGQTTTLCASGGINYLWSPGGQTTACITVSPPTTTTYTVVAVNANGCTGSATVTVVVMPSLSVLISGPTAVCAGQSTTLCASASGGTSYMWSTGATTVCIVVAPVVTTTYSVVATNGGCTGTANVTVTVTSVSLALVQNTTNPLLWNANPVITGTAPFSYLWNFGDGNTSTQAAPTYTYATPGNYIVCLTITDANGCISTACDSVGVVQILNIVNTTGIEENTISVNSVFPNPSNDMIEVSFSDFVKGELKIIDIIGKEIYKENINANNVSVNVSTLPVGYYTLSIVSGVTIMHEKIMIAR